MAGNRIASIAATNQPHMNLEGLAKNGPNSAPGLGFSGLANSSIIDNYGTDLAMNQVLEDFGKNHHAVQAQKFTERPPALTVSPRKAGWRCRCTALTIARR